MNLQHIVPTALASLALSLAAPVFAQNHAHGAADQKAAPQSESDAIAKARAEYPLKTCLVSDEALGSMGEAAPYIHREAGKPDRVIFVCCEGCIDDFKKEPAKYLKKVDAAKQQKSDNKSAKTSKQSGHAHE